MADAHPMGRTLFLVGLLIAAVGAILMAAPRLPWLGRLPGDFLFQRERFTLYVPLASCLLASLVLSVIAWIMGRLK
jgi:hypothetical protein